MTTHKITSQHTTIAALLLFGIGILFSSITFAGGKGGHKNYGPDGFTYAVEVRSSFGTKFYDCFAFDKYSPGILAVQGLFGQLLTYAHDGLNKDKGHWQSTSWGGDILGIAFHGGTSHKGLYISGNGVNEFGDTFVFKGKIDYKCWDDETLRTQTTSPYSSQ